MEREISRAEEAKTAMSRFVNSYGVDSQEFIDLMSREHRTLQQSFTRLCLKWIEKVGSEEYRTDARNEASKEVCHKMLQAFREHSKEKTGGEYPPSTFLGFI